jgi:hypothetical protein
VPGMKAGWSHRSLADSTRIANAASWCKLTASGRSFFREAVLERRAQALEDVVSECEAFIPEENPDICQRHVAQRGHVAPPVHPTSRRTAGRLAVRRRVRFDGPHAGPTRRSVCSERPHDRQRGITLACLHRAATVAI